MSPQSLTRVALAASAALLAVGLTACGGAGLSVGSDGVTAVDGSGAGVSVGPDGVVASDGEGNVVSAGPDGVTAGGSGAGVSVGPDGGSVSGEDVGGRQGTFGTTGQVVLGGAVSWRGTVTASCDVNGDQRTVTARTAAGHTIVIDTNGPEQVTLTVQAAGDIWEADLNGGGGIPVTLTTGRTLVSGARLVGAGDTVTLQANVGC